MIPTSKTLTHTMAGASMTCALLLVVLYGIKAPIHQSVAEAAAPQEQITLADDALTARSAIIYDPVTKQILYAKDAEARLPLASLTKLMSAEAVLSGTPAGESVTITKENLKPEGDWGFRVGEVWKLSDLIHFGLVASSNDAMAAAASALGGNVVDNMNKRAKELGLTQTYFYNPTGLDLDVETAGAYGSAHDVAILAASFLEQFPSEFEATAVRSVSITSPTHSLEATSTAGPLLDIPGLIGAKTGYTDLAGGNLVAAVDISLGHPLIIAVLGSTRDGRFEDVKTLITAARVLFITQH